MRHTMAYRQVGAAGSTSVRLDYKPVVVTRYQPMGASTDGCRDPAPATATAPPETPDPVAFDVTLKIRRFDPDTSPSISGRSSPFRCFPPIASWTACTRSSGSRTAP